MLIVEDDQDPSFIGESPCKEDMSHFKLKQSEETIIEESKSQQDSPDCSINNFVTSIP